MIGLTSASLGGCSRNSENRQPNREQVAANEMLMRTAIQPLVGHEVVSFEREAIGRGSVVHVAIRDGENLGANFDYRADRVNVEVRNGIVVRIISVG